MKDFFIKYLPLHAPGLGSYADLFAMSLCLFITSKFDLSVGRETSMHSLLVVLLVIGIKESAILNNIFTAANLTVIAIVIVAGFTKVNFHNWNVTPDEVGLRPFASTRIHVRPLSGTQHDQCYGARWQRWLFPVRHRRNAHRCCHMLLRVRWIRSRSNDWQVTSLYLILEHHSLFQAKRPRIPNEPFHYQSA